MVDGFENGQGLVELNITSIKVDGLVRLGIYYSSSQRERDTFSNRKREM